MFETWMTKNFIKINTSKTQIKIFRNKTSTVCFKNILNVESEDSVKVLGVNIGDGLKLHKFISKKSTDM